MIVCMISMFVLYLWTCQFCTAIKPLNSLFSYMTLKTNRASLLCYFKLCASFHSHWWIQTSYSPETPNMGQNRRFSEPCDLEIWRVTLKNNRAPLPNNTKLCASFHHHMLIQIGVTVRKLLNRVLTSVTLTCDLWPCHFAWTSFLSLIITPENFMMIRWWEHSEKDVADGRTNWSINIELLGRN